MIKVKISPSTLARWREDEHASWEDHGRPEQGHVWNVLGRAKSRVVVHDQTELALVLRSARYIGDVGGWDDSPAFRRAVQRAASELEAAQAAS